MNLRENSQSELINNPAPAYRYENNQTWIPLPVIPVAAHKPINIQESYNFGGAQANRNAYAGSEYETPNVYRSLATQFHYQFPQTEYYTPQTTPIDHAYQISRLTNCMGGAPRLPGLLPCPYGTDAIACAYHAA